MLPAPIPSPMDQIDIFAPAPMASGGVVGGLNDLQKMSGQMVDALNTVVYGGGQGGGFGDSVSAGGGFGGGNMPPPLPAIAQPLNGLTDQGPMNNPNSRLGPSIGLPFAQPLRMSAEDAYSQAQADARRQCDAGMMGRVKLPGEMSFEQFAEGYNYRPTQPLQAMQGGLGAVPFEDGGPVRMVAGGLAGGTTNLRDTSRPSRDQREERDESSYFGDIPSYGGSEPPSGDGGDDRYTSAKIVDNSEPVADALATIAAMDAAQANFVPGQVTTRERPLSEVSGMDELLNRSQQTQQDVQNLLASMSDIDESAGDFASVSPVASVDSDAASDLGLGFGYLSQPLLSEGTVDYPFYSYPTAAPSDLGFGLGYMSQPLLSEGTVDYPFYSYPAAVRDFGNLDIPMDDFDRRSGDLGKQDALSNFLDRNPPPEPRDDARPDMVMRQNPVVSDPLTDPYRGMGADDFDFGPAAPRTEDLVSNLLNRPVQYTTRGGNVIDRTVQQDLEARGIPSGLPGPLGKVADIFTTQRVGKYLDQIAGGAPGVIDATTGQVIGYVGSGLMDGSQTFTGRAGYNPFTGEAQDVRFDPSVNAYIVTPRIGPDPQEDARASSTSLPTTDTTDTTPPPVTPPTTGLPPAMPDPMNVVVESTRRNVPVTVPNILPGGMPGQGINPTFLPQSFLDLLASFNRPAPRAMQEGGAVLDQAAGNFLEALKVA